MRILPNTTEWNKHLDGSPKRIICHWTAGAYKANAIDKAHYHILIEWDAKKNAVNVIRGVHRIGANDSTSDGEYAAHTGGANTQSIGVAVCGMAGAVQSPFKAGRYPLRIEQWDALQQVTAELCERYKIDTSLEKIARTVLQHSEVHDTLKTEGNSGKFDVSVLPFALELNPFQVYRQFRLGVLERLKALG